MSYKIEYEKWKSYMWLSFGMAVIGFGFFFLHRFTDVEVPFVYYLFIFGGCLIFVFSVMKMRGITKVTECD